MGHKADRSFFDHKRAWSKRKDLILDYYLEPYLAKVRRLHPPVLIVDGFAGPGRFRDGEPGSPLIICEKVKKVSEREGAAISVICIEDEPELFEQLDGNLRTFNFAEAKHGKFLDYICYIETAARQRTVFLYVDPYRASDIHWESLDRVARQIRSVGASVELLMNFNTISFVRWGRAAILGHPPGPDPDEEDSDQFDAPTAELPSAERLTEVVGGPWWEAILRSEASGPDHVKRIADEVGKNLRRRFKEVCWLGIKARSTHLIPKYHMFFGSRHPDALELMNDAMVKAKGHSDFEIDMFAKDDLEKVLLEGAADWIPRRKLMLNVVRQTFCMYYWKEIRGSIESLLKEKRLVSETGKTRINDDTPVKRVPELPGF